MKGDDSAIRSLLQLLGELFREQELGNKELGALVTLEEIYNVQYTALDADVQNTMARLSNDDLAKDETAMRAAKAVALLELIAEHEPTTPELVARCLYPKLGAGSQVEAYRDALNRLYEGGFLSLSETTGYKIQSSAGQEWARERDAYNISGTALSQLMAEKLRELLGRAARPKYKSRFFPMVAFYSDSRGAKDQKLQPSRDPAVVTFEFQYLNKAENREEERWQKYSAREDLNHRIVWVSGDPGPMDAKARELLRSRHMVNRYKPRLQSLAEGRKRFFFDEQTRQERLEDDILDLVADLFVGGSLYFRSRKLNIDRHGQSFTAILVGSAEETLPHLYEHFVDLAITDTELRQLLDISLSGVNHKFLAEGLGLLKLDAGKYVPSCEGEIVGRIREKIDERSGLAGSDLLALFGGPPCGCAPDVVKACVAGLLRAGQVRIRTSSGTTVTSVRDPDVQDLFRGDKEFKRAEIFPGETVISGKMRNMIRKFFHKTLNHDIEPDIEIIADEAFNRFPKVRESLSELQFRLNRIRPRPELPKSLEALPQVFEKCLASRQVEPTVQQIHKNLDTLRDGIHELGIYRGDLTDEAMALLKEAQRAFEKEFVQLEELGLEQAVSEAGFELKQQLGAPKPWREIHTTTAHVETIVTAYREARIRLLNKHEDLAETYREAIKRRDGFSKLDQQATSNVLRPIREALADTTPEAISPNLAFLRDSIPVRLGKASEEANRRLDALLAEKEQVQVVQLQTGLSGREVKNEKDVESLLTELRERLLAQLKDDVRIRLV